MLGGKDVGELRLKRVRVLVLVHEHVKEVLLQEIAHAVVLSKEAQSVHKQVVEVHRAKLALLGLVRAAYGQHLLGVDGGLGLVAAHHLLKIARAVGGVRDELEQELLLLEVLDVLDVLLDRLAHELLLVVLVEDREAWLVAEAAAVLAQEARADVMERAAPDRVKPGHELPGALEHLLGGAVGEGEQQDALRRNALLHQIGHTVHERARLSRAGRRQHEERTVRRRSRRALLAVENLAEIYSVHGKSACNYTTSPRRLHADTLCYNGGTCKKRRFT